MGAMLKTFETEKVRVSAASLDHICSGVVFYIRASDYLVKH